MSSPADDAEFAAWAQAEVSTWPRLTGLARARLSILLDQTISAVEVLTRLRLLPALLSESDQAVTVSHRGSQPPDNNSEVTS